MLYLIYLFFVSSLIFIDQFTKSLVVSHLTLNSSVEVIEDFFSFTYVQNYGAGFSIMQNATTTFYIITPICLALFVFLLLKTKKGQILERCAIVLMIGGTIGNFIDRLTHVYVIDFLDFNFFGWDFPIFNFADICLTIGVFLYLITVLRESKHAKA